MSEVHTNSLQGYFSAMAKRHKYLKFETIYMVPHAHLDLSWMGTPSECEKINNGIMESAVELLVSQPEFRYTVEAVRPLELFLAENPDVKQKVERFFSEGRLEVGGMYVDVACDYCFDESLVRNLAIGQSWLQKTLGQISDICREEDVSSHFAQAPQLLGKSGFSYLKLSRGPVGVFRWAAPDGSEVITALFEYNHSYHFCLGRSSELTRQNMPGYLSWMETKIKQPLSVLMLMDGDDCTPPNPNLTEIAATWNKTTETPKIRIATVREYLKSIPHDNLPLRCGDMPSFWAAVMLFELEAAKKLQEAEPLIMSAEKFAAGCFLVGGPMPKNLEQTWKLLLTAQDHNWGGKDESKHGVQADIDKVEMINSVIDVSKDTLKTAINCIAENIRHTRSGVPLTVFNSLSWERDDIVNFTVPEVLESENLKIINHEGTEIPFQFEPDSEDGEGRKVLLIAGNVPPAGYKTFYIQKDAAAHLQSLESTRDTVLENDHYRIELNRRKNGIKRIFDKELSLDVAGMNHRKVLNAIGIDIPFPALVAIGGRFAIQPQEFYENPENLMKGRAGEGMEFLWKAWRPSQYKIHKFVKSQGRIARILMINGTFLKSPVALEIVLYEKIKRVDIRATIDWQGEPGVFLAMLFPMPFKQEEVHIGTPFFVHKMGDEAEGFWKMPGLPISPKIRGIQHWFSAGDKRRTVTISSPWRVWDFTLMPAALLMASDKNNGFFKGERYLQKGRHTWSFSLFSNSGDWKQGMSYRRGIEPINPMIPVVGSGKKNGGNNAGAMSFCKVAPHNIILTCLKGSDSGDGSILARFYEVEGKETNVELEFPKKIVKAMVTDLLEREENTLETRENKVLCKLMPYEIGSVKVFF